MARPTVELELDPAHARDLTAGGVFVSGCALRITEECNLLVRGAAGTLPLVARVVFVDPSGRGAGLEVVGFGPELRQRIADLAAAPARPASALKLDLDPEAEPDAQTTADVSFEVEVDFDVATQPAVVAATPEPDPPEEDLELAPEPIRDVSAGSAMDFPMDPSIGEVQTYALEGESPAAPAFDPEATQPLSLEEMDDATRDDDAGPDGEAGDDSATGDDARRAKNLHERLRGLTLVQQLKIAHTGEMQERILLERIYGKTVWEALLRNPKLTAQEVARIARMGALPRPLLEQIVGNGGWLQVPEVRRALLTHPRLAADQIVRILRLLPKHELKLAAAQTVYPAQVRDHARKLLKD